MPTDLPLISLCIITGNEEPLIVRFLDSFADAFDELCIVRAVGSMKPDETLRLARQWCKDRGKRYKSGEYHNAENYTGKPETDVDPHNPKTWPHVDDFGAARNVAWRMATGAWQFWADVDDVLLTPAPGEIGGAQLLRLCAEAGQHDFYLFKYSLRQQSESNVRERLFRTGISRWIQPVHEQVRCIAEPDGSKNETPLKACIEERVVYEHLPTLEKHRDDWRNRRIMEYALRWVHTFSFEVMREYFYQWQAFRKLEDAEKATKWADITMQTDCLVEQRYDTVLMQAQIAAEASIDHAVELCWAAIRINPKLRSAWGDLARYHLKAGNGNLAAVATTFMQGLVKPAANGYPTAEKYYGWQGADLRVISLRAAGNEAAARTTEERIFEANGRRISLLHATRGRPDLAIRTRDLFMQGALVPLGVEHIFAIDEDDTASREALKNYRHVIVNEPRGSVKAWNEAAKASSGAVLVQLSDDWIPSFDWDAAVWSALVKAANERREAGREWSPEVTDGLKLRTTSLILAVSDNHRTDALLCMAILTRARYEHQRMEAGAPYLFHPDYFGVLSDNEFTVRAYEDGVVVDARHIRFDHQHPIFLGKPVEQWDETHRRQNEPERYKEGVAIFNRRNPKHAVALP